MKAQKGDLIRIKNLNNLSLYYSVHKVTNVTEHPISKKTCYVFKLNEQETWIDEEDTQVLLGENSGQYVENLASLRIIIDTVCAVIRSFGVNSELLNYCLTVCMETTELDPDYQLIISDYNSQNVIDKNKIVELSTQYYNALQLVEQTLVQEKTPSVFTNILNSIQKIKDQYTTISEIEEPIQDTNSQTELENQEVETTQELPVELSAIEKEEIQEQISFLESILVDDLTNKDKVEEEINILRNKLNESYEDVIGMIVQPLISLMDAIASLNDADKVYEHDYNPNNDQVVKDNIEGLYDGFKAVLNDKVLDGWKKLTSETFKTMLEDKNSLPELSIQQLVDLFTLMKTYENKK